MKAAVQLQQFKKCLILFMVGIICSALAYALYVINPIKALLEYKLQMAPGSTVFTIWQTPPIDIYIKVYIFNITNPTEFLNGEEKLKVQEIGPYVYKEILKNENVTWNDNGTMSYTPRRTVVYVPEMSVGDPEQDLVMVPNIPMLGITSALRNAGFFVNFPLARLTNYLDSKPILNISVYEYLWGYEDPLVQLASGIVPKFINFQKFGLLDRMYDEGDNTVVMNIKKNENMTDEAGRYLSIESFNGSPGLAYWGYVDVEGNETNPANTMCNRVQGATEGCIFPDNLDRNAVFRVYRKAFCRTMPIVFKKEVVENGFPAYLYSLSDDFLETPDKNPDNECYCRKMEKCLKKGLTDVTPCYYNIPAALSLPHFLDADPTLLEGVEGLHPEEEKHRTKILLQPTVGIPLYVNSRLQTNLVMDHTVYNSRVTPFNDLTVPLFWTDLHIPNLPSDLLLLLRLCLQVLPVVQTVLICLLGIVGVTTFFLSLIGSLWVLNQQQDEEDKKRKDSCDLRIPLGYGQYTAIRILPAIKKITSKTDLFG
ncbi:scavenger receptor class B member 1 isoform X1 [Cephus cinctus]|uniref:Scavenger receptor class B member 1 isoform X1 n=1 Tax=Cephus cinctus TaxID=211228 RepID=A0AAJ7FPI9_CEPCN|nr:scavenger receptor class B member 1 isoform X1 [Cephus cinctus]XP_024943774.1 scavenger receptor class B member 1 isoform X1 [Cephus cinctus]